MQADKKLMYMSREIGLRASIPSSMIDEERNAVIFPNHANADRRVGCERSGTIREIQSRSAPTPININPSPELPSYRRDYGSLGGKESGSVRQEGPVSPAGRGLSITGSSVISLRPESAMMHASRDVSVTYTPTVYVYIYFWIKL